MHIAEDRWFRLVHEAIDCLGLDLSGAIVLTEMGSGLFGLTPLIAAAAGAQSVIAVSKDSRFGKAADVLRDGIALARRWGIDDRIEPTASLSSGQIARADIVTNLGFVRPINAAFVSQMKRGAVLAHMCEAWEIRPEDVDLPACRSNDVPVMGVWEGDDRVRVFDDCGLLAAKMLFEAGVEIRLNRILVLSSDAFGTVISSTLRALGATVTLWKGPADFDASILGGIDAVLAADYRSPDLLIGSGGWLDIDAFQAASRGAVVVPLVGRVDSSALRRAGFSCHPSEEGASRRMTRTLAHLGPRPLIYLHAGGLKVGELMWRERRTQPSSKLVEETLARTSPLCQRIGE